MKKLFITIVAIFMPMLAMGQILYMNDFTGITEFTGWSQFDDSQTDGRVEVDPDGVAITVGIQTGQLWQPRIMVVPDGSFNLEAGSKYTVVVTAKFPTSGTLQINMGTWSYNDQANFPIVDTGDFQEVVCEFPDWTVNAEGAHLLFQCGDFKGTTILKKIEIWKGESLHTGKWTVAGDKDLLNANWDITYNSNIMYTSDNEKYSLTKTNLMLPKGTYEFKVYNNSSTQESYPSTNATLVVDENAQYTVVFTFNVNTKEVSAAATKTDGIFYNFIEKAKIAEVIQNPKNYKGNIIIPEKVTHEGIEYTVTKIADNAFSYCESLTSVTIPNSVTSIGQSAFKRCSKLTSVMLPNSITAINNYVFQSCSSLTNVTIPNNVKSIGSGAFQGCSSLTDFTIPNNLISIGESAFSGCAGLTSITIPNNVTSLGNYAFANCTGLTSFTIPSSITYIGGSMFSGCTSLTSITIPNSVTDIYNSAFSGCTGLTSITIPNSVTTIYDSAFSGCTGLTSITIPNSISYIGGSMFSGCTSLTSVTIPNSVTTICESAFSGCSGLTSVSIPNSVNGIGSQAFNGCSGLTSVTIGSGVNYIYDNAFANCDNLENVYCMVEDLSSLSTATSAFDGSYIDYASLYVPASAINTYMTTAPWSGFGDYKTLSGEAIETKKCATPNISFENGEIIFSCETEGVEYISNITAPDAKAYYDGRIKPTYKYTVSVYATKAGYLNSDTATSEFSATGVFGDLNGDGKVNVADHVKLSSIIMDQNE